MNKTNNRSEHRILQAVTDAKNEIICEFRKVRNAAGKPPCKRLAVRGPKNTKMMKVERKILETYLEIERHRDISSCTPTDALHVWNLPENKTDFDNAAVRSDESRGYPDPVALANAVIYWHDKKILKQHRLRTSR